MQELFKLTRQVLSEQLAMDPNDIQMESSFEDINADSIDIIEVLMALEDAYDVEFPEEDLGSYPTVGSLVKALYSFLKQVEK